MTSLSKKLPLQKEKQYIAGCYNITVVFKEDLSIYISFICINNFIGSSSTLTFYFILHDGQLFWDHCFIFLWIESTSYVHFCCKLIHFSLISTEMIELQFYRSSFQDLNIQKHSCSNIFWDTSLSHHTSDAFQLNWHGAIIQAGMLLVT